MSNTTNNGETVANGIISQLGGARIFAMAFKSAAYDAASVTFKIGVPQKLVTGKATHVIVTLDEDDTYTVKTVKAGRLNRRTWEFPETVTVAELSMVHADSLRLVVESQTGLRLSL